MTADLQRKLTTIFAADAVGYSKSMGTDEARTVSRLREDRGVFSRLIARHHGRIANTAGDGLIAEFPSVVEAVQCAIEAQTELGDPQNRPGGLDYRIGIHLGDVIVDGGDLLGDGVNLAARLEGMAEPGGILISQQVYDQVHAKLTVGFEYLGEKRPKNLVEDVPVYRVAMGAPTISVAGHVRDRWRRVTASQTQPPVTPPETAPGAQRRFMGWSDPARVGQMVKMGAIVGAFLLLIDLTTGGGFWAHWPIAAGATFIGARWISAQPFSPADKSLYQAIELSVFLILVNLFSWSGTFWAVWPTAALIAFALLRRVRSESDS